MTQTTAPPKTLPGIYKPKASSTARFGICIYGRRGVGKTTLAGTMPGKGLVIDVPQLEGGTHVLEDVADRVDVYPIERWDQAQDAFWFLKNQTHDYKWVAIDSLTALTELAKRKVVGERNDPDLRATPHKIRIQDWGDINQLLIEFCVQFRLLNVHTIWIAQEASHGNAENNEPVWVGPDSRDKVLNVLLPSMLLTGRLYIEHLFDGSSERRFRIGPHELYESKYRSKPGIDVPPVIVNANLGGLLRYLFGQGDRPQEPADETTLILQEVS